MKIPKGATVAVADGETLKMFRNEGDESDPKLIVIPISEVSSENTGFGSRHHNSSANPSDSQLAEDNFAAGVADHLNRRVLDGNMGGLIVVAAPRTLGELRKHYHKALSAILLGEISKDLTGHTAADVERAISVA